MNPSAGVQTLDRAVPIETRVRFMNAAATGDRFPACVMSCGADDRGFIQSEARHQELDVPSHYEFR
jgi:hypothetical protein